MNERDTLRHGLPLLLLAGMLAAPFSACTSAIHPGDVRAARPASQSCAHWSLGVTAPRHMEAWVEDIEVKDDRGRWISMSVGMATSTGQTAGWGNGQWAGNSDTVRAAGLPTVVSIRWQSLAEPQTYTWQFNVPESVRQSLTAIVPVTSQGTSDTSCRSNLTIGVAPRGRTIVWINGLGFQPTEVMRGQAEIEPLGPDQGKHEGRYVRLSDKAKQYIKEHGILYDSWDPPPSSHLVTTTSDENLPPSPAIDLAAHPEGLYQLVGVMETSSAIALYPNGRFEAGIDYGAAYGHATGHWTRKDTTITLTRESKDLPRKRTDQLAVDDLSPLFDRLQLTIDGHCLRTVMMSRDACYLRQ